jgi:hypothetical protein
MDLSQAKADAIRPQLNLLAAALTGAGLSFHGLVLTGTTLLTGDAGGSLAELSPEAQAFVASYTPAAAPATPSYGSDLMTDDQTKAQAATLVTQLRQYIGLAAPTAAQQKSWENGVSKILIYLIHDRFPGL